MIRDLVDVAVGFAIGQFPHTTRLAVDTIYVAAGIALIAASLAAFYALGVSVGWLIRRAAEPLYPLAFRWAYPGRHRSNVLIGG